MGRDTGMGVGRVFRYDLKYHSKCRCILWQCVSYVCIVDLALHGS